MQKMGKEITHLRLKEFVMKEKLQLENNRLRIETTGKGGTACHHDKLVHGGHPMQETIQIIYHFHQRGMAGILN